MSWLMSIHASLPVRDPVLVFALAMLVILLAPLLAKRAKMPEIIGLILAGILLGEHGLNILARDDTMILLGTVGMLYILFLAGLQMDVVQLSQQRFSSLLFGVMTFSIPMALGVTVARHVLDFPWPAAILLASMFASHTLLGYPAAFRLGITRNPAVTATIGGSIITDTLALMVLAVIAASSSGDLTTWFWIQTALSLLVFVLVVTLGVTPLARYYFRKHGDQEARDFVFVLAIGFLSAYAAKLAGLEPIIGAFLGGLVLSRSITPQSPLMHRVQFVGNALFVPFFLISVGMLVDLKLIFSSWRLWLVGGSMVLTVTSAKWLAAWVSSRLLGFTRDEGRVMFGLSVTQAAATLAAVFVGYRIGLFNEEVLNGAVLMILATCMIGPAYVERYGRRVARHEEMGPLRPGQTPLRILIPLANPASAPALMELAFIMRRPHSPEPVYPLTVADPSGDVDRQVAAGERMLGHAVIYASGAGVPVQPVTRVDANVANGINRAITELRISTVVIGWTGIRSRRRLALGKVLNQLLRENLQAIVVCRLLQPLNTTQRVILLIPPFAIRERGFAEAARTVKMMTSRLSARLHIIAPHQEIRDLDTHVGPIRPAVSTSFHGASSAELMQGTIGTLPVGKDDMIILLSTREGRLSWSDKLGELPVRLAERFADNNLLLFYPPETQEEQAVLPAASAGLLDPRRTFLGMSAANFREAVVAMISPHFREPEEEAIVRQLLENNTREYSTEIAPGAILVHAHVPELNEPLLFFGTHITGLSISNVDQPVHVILLLVSPTEGPAAEHLDALAGLARMMRGQDLVQRLLPITSYEALREHLTEEKTEGA